MKKKPRIEDAIIGTFVVLAVLYPFITAMLIHFRHMGFEEDPVFLMRDTYNFIGGLRECDHVTSYRIVSSMSDSALEVVGGSKGITNLCRANRLRSRGSVKVEEHIEREEDHITMSANITYGDGGSIKLKLEGSLKGGDLLIEEVVYAEGS